MYCLGVKYETHSFARTTTLDICGAFGRYHYVVVGSIPAFIGVSLCGELDIKDNVQLPIFVS